MHTSLRAFTTADIDASERWRSAIVLGRFMSRSAPLRFDGTLDPKGGDYQWFVIVVDGLDAGTIWLEKEPDESDVVRLGIFLGDEAHFGKGVGRQAIAQVIEQCRALLGFSRVRLSVRLDNPRAIACYRACGFQEIGRGTKPGGSGTIRFVTMERDANCNSIR